MIAIRAAEPTDAAAIAAIYAPFVLSGTVSFESEAPDARAMRGRMAASDGLYPWLVATNGDSEGGGVLGYAYASRFRDRPAYHWTTETSIYLAGDAQQRGVGRLLYEALLDTLRAQGFIQAIGTIALPNDASIKLHEQVGFRRAGVIREAGFKFGRWIDIGFWQCELADAASPPRPVRPFSEIGVVRD
ncbi:GNAT family N-acetyltransferase [Sphingomonas yantingensis]|uniref:Phosphinothricin acetyltransferase n=1 Tax=Sphingomonas yantingensis TaxID=1241761 RepID=A0A7W9EIE0_9SPHN|nr:phosphinothricin acetyltransferase [Sphingomonas yantingensis]